MSSNFTPVTVESVANGKFVGSLHNLVTDAAINSINGHLIDSEGVISADYFLQQTLEEQLGRSLTSKLQVGAPEYIRKHSEFLNDADSIKFEAEADSGFFPVGKKNDLPLGARSFLPRDVDSPAPGIRFRPMDDSLTQLKTQQILNLFFGYYRNIDFQLDWNNNRVNAVAWIDESGRHVRIYGGLVRHPDMAAEGVSLVVAHEVAHHFGGPPTYPGSTLSCEGQADYWAALIVMRNVFPEDEYIETITPAIEQVYNLLTAGLIKNLNDPEFKTRFDDNPCDHPPADCRRDTYEAAVRLDPKPACAG
ncbi:MAG: hypothetical protein AAGA80_00930 [Cyanobacteria bacterium P01_F01_bin.143]